MSEHLPNLVYRPVAFDDPIDMVSLLVACDKYLGGSTLTTYRPVYEFTPDPIEIPNSTKDIINFMFGTSFPFATPDSARPFIFRQLLLGNKKVSAHTIPLVQRFPFEWIHDTFSLCVKVCVTIEHTNEQEYNTIKIQISKDGKWCIEGGKMNLTTKMKSELTTIKGWHREVASIQSDSEIELEQCLNRWHLKPMSIQL